ELYVLTNTRNAPSLPDLNTGLPAGVLFKIEAEPPILGFVDTFSAPGTNLWTSSSGLSNPGTGGVDGDGDGFLNITNAFSFNFGARSASVNYQGDWTAAGITELSLYLNDIGADEPF